MKHLSVERVIMGMGNGKCLSPSSPFLLFSALFLDWN
jgi:hypothetical protein